METIELIGILSRYPYQRADLNLPWNDIGGCYAFVNYSSGYPYVVRVGKCDSFKTRPMPPGHECWADAVRDHGATHLYVRVIPNEADRAMEEQDLIAAYNPPMNTHHRTGLTGLAAPQLGLFSLGLINRGAKQ
jgi:hypothetical protein